MKTNQKTKIFIGGLIVAIFLGWLWWGNTAIQGDPVNFSSEKIGTALDGFTIVQVSDLHNAEFGRDQATLLNLVEQASPDLIAITGDLIDSDHSDVNAAMQFIRGAVKLAPVYFVTGNHEAWSLQYPELKEQLTLAGVTILDNEKIVIKHNGAAFNLLGLLDPAFKTTDDVKTDAGKVDKVLKELTDLNNELTILLAHRPELFDIYADHPIDLVLSGHAHGGQFRLPLVGGLIAPNQGFFPKYSAGIYTKDRTTLIVSRGLGNSLIPLRVNNRPDLVIITLRK